MKVWAWFKFRQTATLVLSVATASGVMVATIIAIFSAGGLVEIADAHEGLAAWAQAIVTVLTIWFAFRTMRLQLKQQDIDLRIKTLNILITLQKVAIDRFGKMSSMADSKITRSTPYAPTTSDQLEFLTRALSRVDIVHLEPEAIVILASTVSRVEQAKRRVDSFSKALRIRDDDEKEKKLKSIRDQLKNLANKCEADLQKLTT